MLDTLYTYATLKQVEKLFNKSQLARFLGIAPQTMTKRIREGKYKPVIEDGKGRQLFRKPKKSHGAS